MEVYKEIPNFNNYVVSNYGNIKSIRTNKTLIPHHLHASKSLYCFVGLCINGKRKNCLVHRLVALAFLPNPNNKKTVNHKDHNPLNNSVWNLEWATHKEQNEHRRKPSKNKQELISSRKVLIKDMTTNEELTFDSMVYACKHIYDSNANLFTQYEDFDGAKPTLKSRLCKAIRKETPGETLYGKYKASYFQDEVLENEFWKEIPSEIIAGKGNCFVSSRARVKNNKGRITEGFLHTNGYFKVRLSPKTYSLHRLVAQVFVPNPKNDVQVNHIDGNKRNNRIENLEWVSPSNNCIHRSNELYSQYLRRVYQYDLQMNFIKEYKSTVEASKQTNIKAKAICSCCNEKQVQTNGFIFRFEHNRCKIRKNKCLKPVIQYDLQNNRIAAYASIVEASKTLSINCNCICCCCRGKQKTAGGYIFKYK